jgi:hypothetical protein
MCDRPRSVELYDSQWECRLSTVLKETSLVAKPGLYNLEEEGRIPYDDITIGYDWMSGVETSPRPAVLARFLG